MITIQNTKTIAEKPITISIPSKNTTTIDAKGLTLLPGLIDPHVHFRTPGMEHKENWLSAANAAIHGGYTTVFDMPNTLPPTITAELLAEKKSIIDAQLKEAGVPLRYELFFGADKAHLSQIHKVRNQVIGIKVFMGCSTGNLAIDDDESLHAVFAIAATQNMLVAVHAEDEDRIKARKHQYADARDYPIHSVIRDHEVARIAVAKAINLSRIYNTRLYILHVSCQDEIELIRKAKADGLNVYAETTPHHLFLNEDYYPQLQGNIVVNPPVRAAIQNNILLDAINEGVIDTIGSDHAPHTIEEKSKAYGQCPSGMPGIETTLPLLLNAYHRGLITLERIVQLTSTRARDIFGLPQTDDVVLVDLNKELSVDPARLKTKCGWSAFAGMKLKGWPVYTIVNGHCFDLMALSDHKTTNSMSCST